MRVKGLAILKATRRQRREWSCKIKTGRGKVKRTRGKIM